MNWLTGCRMIYSTVLVGALVGCEVFCVAVWPVRNARYVPLRSEPFP